MHPYYRRSLEMKDYALALHKPAVSIFSQRRMYIVALNLYTTSFSSNFVFQLSNIATKLLELPMKLFIINSILQIQYQNLKFIF